MTKTMKLNLGETSCKSNEIKHGELYAEDIRDFDFNNKDNNMKVLTDINQVNLGDLVIIDLDPKFKGGGYIFDMDKNTSMLSVVIANADGFGKTVRSADVKHSERDLYYRNDGNVELVKGNEHGRVWFKRIDDFLAKQFDVDAYSSVEVDVTDYEFYPELVSTADFKCRLDETNPQKRVAIVENITPNKLHLDYGDILGKPLSRELVEVYGNDVDYSQVRSLFIPSFEEELTSDSIKTLQEDDAVFGVEIYGNTLRVCSGLVKNTKEDTVVVYCNDAYNGGRAYELSLDDGKIFKIPNDNILNPAFL